MAPQITENQKEMKLEASKSGFDLISKTEVQLKKTGTDTPVSSINDFVSRLNNDSAAILKLVQNAYREYAEERLAGNSEPWLLATQEKDSSGAEKEVLVPFEGFLLEGERLKNFQATVLNAAKSFFAYPDEKPAKGSTPEEVKAWQEAKRVATDSARDMFLSNPAAVAALKK